MTVLIIRDDFMWTIFNFYGAIFDAQKHAPKTCKYGTGFRAKRIPLLHTEIDRASEREIHGDNRADTHEHCSLTPSRIRPALKASVMAELSTRRAISLVLHTIALRSIYTEDT